MILELKNLEVLELWALGRVERNAMNKLHKLEKLKILKTSLGFSMNILRDLQFGVFENLEELDASFLGASVEATREMKRITPNLKKIWYENFSSDSADTINAMLDALEHLEAVQIKNGEFVVPDKVYPNIKTLFVFCKPGFRFNAEHISKAFPNLEVFVTDQSHFEVTESFFAQLSGMKHLKALYMFI
jgi:hypothetical protein